MHFYLDISEKIWYNIDVNYEKGILKCRLQDRQSTY